MAIIPIRDVPGNPVQPSGDELILIDNGIAMQKATINDAVTPKASEIADQKIADLNLGTAAQANVEDFATAAQGDLADSAVQPGDLAPVATSGDYNDLANLPTLGTAAEADVDDFAPAAQAVPTGGATGQVLVKETNDDNDVGWATVAAATAVSYAPQTLNSGQKAQARENIDALGPEETPDRAFRRGNILGTVSQSGGTPTGAIIERGSNANGEYVRFADGTQICVKRMSLPGAVDTAIGSLFFSSNKDLGNWPAAFVANPYRSLFQRGPFGLYAGGTITETSAGTVAFWRPTSVASVDNPDVDVIGIGRWF